MNHHPECSIAIDGPCCHWMPQPCNCQCICDILEPAYQRGREDAAKAIEDLIGPTQPWQPAWHWWDITNAARGKDV